MSRRSIALAAAALAAGACQTSHNVCGSTQSPLVGPDGGDHLCVVAEDCPRDSDRIVCVTTGDLEQDCVACVDGRCVERIAEPCT